MIFPTLIRVGGPENHPNDCQINDRNDDNNVISFALLKMPGVGAYSNEFKLRQGTVVGGWVLSSVQVSEEPVEEDQEYHYPTRLMFQRQADLPGSATPAQLLSLVNAMMGSLRIIYSDYGNPYGCHFGLLSSSAGSADDQVVLQTVGDCVRDRTLPKKF